MSQTLEVDEKVEGPPAKPRRLEVTMYQIADDRLMKENRSDGQGWEWCWADWQREWMDATSNRFAYRCLPLTIANQTGLWVKNPVTFTATWGGLDKQGDIRFDFATAADEAWKNWISNIFGSGIITWNTPFLFRTRPEGSRLMVSGPANYFKDNAHPLTAIIESDWMVMSFTMNWKMLRPHHPVTFEVGEPLFQAIPILNNACLDLEKALVNYRKLDDDPEISRSYREWDKSRSEFVKLNQEGKLKPDDWQRDYFLGRDAAGRPQAPAHMTKVKSPKVIYDGSMEAPKVAGCPVAHGQAAPGVGAAVAKSSLGPARTSARKLAAAGGDVTQNGTAIAAADRVPSSSPMTDAWRRWVAENLMLGAARQSILERMIEEGFGRDEAAAEIDLALNHPYFGAASRLQNRLKKRDWMLATYRKLGRLRPASGEVERQHGMTRDMLLDRYYCANRPVILTGILDDWPALEKWGLRYFSEKLADRRVDARLSANPGGSDPDRGGPSRHNVAFSPFIETLGTTGVARVLEIAAGDSPANQDALGVLLADTLPVPEYLDERAPLTASFRFGPPGAFTPFHQDLANTLMAQVTGRQRYLLAPSWDMPLMRNLTHVFSEVDGRVTPPTPHALPGQPQVVECVLNPGEVLFLPVGCWQFAEVLETSASLSFTSFAFDDNDYSSFYETFESV